MSRPLIVMGDATSHGGRVLAGSPASTTGGRPVARVGDAVTCPIPGHGSNRIVSGDACLIVDGQPAARHGDKTACGASLLASQPATTSG
ncbi:MAG: hypothetical protein CMN28_03730 [Salinisphaeraceae bacterium]|nr:hypothetical protein [Salinisphaeraceae bacterium]